MGLDRQVLVAASSPAPRWTRPRKKSGLAISDADIARVIKADKTFAGLNGAFDQSRMDEILRDNGYSEASLCARTAPGLPAPGNRRRGDRRAQDAATSCSPRSTLSPTKPARPIISSSPPPTPARPPRRPRTRSSLIYDLRKDNYRTPEISQGQRAGRVAGRDREKPAPFPTTPPDRFTTATSRSVFRRRKTRRVANDLPQPRGGGKGRASASRRARVSKRSPRKADGRRGRRSRDRQDQGGDFRQGHGRGRIRLAPTRRHRPNQWPVRLGAGARQQDRAGKDQEF